MTTRQLVRRGRGAASADIDGEIVLISPVDNRCYALNPTASHVWNLLPPADHAPVAFADLIDQLTAAFDIDHGTCEAEVATLLEEFATAGIVAFDD
jgi:hypothetical protein